MDAGTPQKVRKSSLVLAIILWAVAALTWMFRRLISHWRVMKVWRVNDSAAERDAEAEESGVAGEVDVAPDFEDLPEDEVARELGPYGEVEVVLSIVST